MSNGQWQPGGSLETPRGPCDQLDNPVLEYRAYVDHLHVSKQFTYTVVQLGRAKTTYVTPQCYSLCHKAALKNLPSSFKLMK